MNPSDFDAWLADKGFTIINDTGYKSGPSEDIKTCASIADFQQFILLYAQFFQPHAVSKMNLHPGSYTYEVTNGQFGRSITLYSPAQVAPPPMGPVPEIIDALTGQPKLLSMEKQYIDLVNVSDSQQMQVSSLTDQLVQAQDKYAQTQAQLKQVQQDNGSAAQIADLQAKLDTATTSLTSAQIQIGTLQSAIDTQQAQLSQVGEPTAPVPAFLDQTKDPYLPFFQFVEPGGSFDGVTCHEPRDLFIPTTKMRQEVANSGYEKLDKYDRLMLGLKLMIQRGFQYRADDGDNHQLPIQTEARQRGDCQDLAYFVASYWRLLKILPDAAFDTTGDTNFGYHEWPIAYLSADDIKGKPVEKYGPGWFIYEATLTYLPPCPMPLSGSAYHVVDGMANWAFKGKIKPDFANDFNMGNVSAPAGKAQRVKNNDSKEKRLAINKHWQDWHTKEGHLPKLR